MRILSQILPEFHADSESTSLVQMSLKGPIISIEDDEDDQYLIERILKASDLTGFQEQIKLIINY